MSEWLPMVAIYLVGAVTGGYLTHALHRAWCRWVPRAPRVFSPGQPCPKCGGVGWLETIWGTDHDCRDCGGTGRRT